MRKALMSLAVVLGVTVSTNATLLLDGDFEAAGTATTIPNASAAGSMNEVPWMYDIDKNGGGTLAGTINPSVTNLTNVYAGAQSLRISITGTDASVSVYQILTSDMTNGMTVNYTYAVRPNTLAGSYWVEVGYVKNVANGATVVDPNNAGSDAVLIQKWDAWGLPTGGPTLASQLNTWVTGSGSLMLSNTTSTVAFFVKVGGGAGNNVYFDNLTFTPEPVALALLGLPMLLIRRRR